MPSRIQQKNHVPLNKAGVRLDQVAAELFPDYSRSRLKSWLETGELLVNGIQVKPNMRVTGGEKLELDALVIEEGEWQAEEIPLDIVHEDEQILVLNKPAGLVVHPASGNWNGTLLNGLVAHNESFRTLPRAGIVHRLDKDTTGLMVVAKTLEAQNNLVNQLQARSVKREYLALVWGIPLSEGIIKTDIGRHPTARTKMAVVKSGGKPAITHYQVLQESGALSLVRLKLETGRTHQIRVHMGHLGFPLVGDPTYGKKTINIVQTAIDLDCAKHFKRQALHAETLGLIHPKSGLSCQWHVDLPEDFSTLLNALNF